VKPGSVCLSVQVGPRMELEVVKVEEGLCDGRVLYHGYVEKSSGEVRQLDEKKARREAAEKLRRERRDQQVTDRTDGLADCLAPYCPKRPQRSCRTDRQTGRVVHADADASASPGLRV
jgi:hypothetical protein